MDEPAMATIALLEPYYTGSHAAWVDGLVQHSGHKIVPITLPGRFWKWRMHGGAVTLAREILHRDEQFDLILTTDMLDTALFRGLSCRKTDHLPVAVYMHENQLTYPPPPGSKRDLHYGFINYSSMLAADRVFFNSEYHKDIFLDELPRLLKHFPDFNELETIELIRGKSDVLPLGLDLKRLDHHQTSRSPGEPPTILWNHRWEYDKQPQQFFEALYELQTRCVDFRLIVLGEGFRQRPLEFNEARGRLADKIVHFGYASTLHDYTKLLWISDVQVSCAIQDFFGASTCEAIYCNCVPILPARLNYPAFIPEAFHEHYLYRTTDELVDRLVWCATHIQEVRATSFRQHVARYDWRTLVKTYDSAFASLCQS